MDENEIPTKEKAPRADVVLPPSLSPEHPDYTRERYSVPQAAAYLLVSPSRIYADTSAGQLAHRKDGNRRLRFSQADLDAVQASSRAPCVPPQLPLPKTLRFNH